MVRRSSKVQAFQASLEEPARALWGHRWKTALARAAGVSPETLKTLFYRGQRLPEPEVVAALRRAVGLPSPSPGETPALPFHLTAGFQERRRFTAMVEALRRIDAQGSGRDWQIAWAAVDGLRDVLQRLAGWNEADWQRLLEERLDWWRTITGQPEPDARLEEV